LEVWGSGGDLGFTRDGTHAQLVAIPVTALKTKPRKLSFEQAGAVGVPGVTALSALKISLLKPEKFLLVIGAAGGVGSMAVQIAKWRGSRVIGGVLDANGVQQAKDAGAESTVLIGKQDLKAVTDEFTQGRGVDVVLNTAGSEMVEPALSCLANGGRLVVINAGAQPRVTFDLPDFYHRELRILGLNTLNLDMINSTAILHELAAGYDSGQLQPPSVKAIPLEQAAVGYQVVEKGLSARLVLVPSSNS
jgi:NADPH:quinone reductase-like Zn-dependent oxidoreductase